MSPATPTGRSSASSATGRCERVWNCIPRRKVGSGERGSVASRQAHILAYETARCQYSSITAVGSPTDHVSLLPTLGLGVRVGTLRSELPRCYRPAPENLFSTSAQL